MKRNNKLDTVIENMSEEELEAHLQLIHEIELEELANPLSTFKKGNPKQTDLIHSQHNVTLVLCGNRFGKTFAMCYMLAAIATGELAHARHQPDSNRVLRVWFIAKSYKTLNDEILKTLTGFLRKDQYRTIKDGPYVSKIHIYGPNGEITEVLFKPSTADPDTFESASLHYIFVDEGITEAMFAGLMIRLGGNNGQYFQCYTRLSYNFVTDLAQGKGRFKELLNKGYVKVIEGVTRENVFLTDEEHEFMEAAMDGDEFMKKARLQGKIDKPQGAVFLMRDVITDPFTGEEYNYNLFNFSEILNILDELEWYLGHDYGFRDPSVFLLKGVHRKTGTVYNIEEIYQSGLSPQKAGELVYDMLTRWDCYHKVKMCVADKQIKSKDANATSILSQYLLARMPDGTPCFPPQMGWRCKETDKRDPHQSLQLVNAMIEMENPNTPGFPYYRYSIKCSKTMHELRTIEWREPGLSSNSREITKGRDDATAVERYFSMARINVSAWKGRKKDDAFNEYSYLVGGSRGTYFNF